MGVRVSSIGRMIFICFFFGFRIMYKTGSKPLEASAGHMRARRVG